MSWFRSALSISILEPGSYYTVIDPLEFYEWRFTQTAPKGAKFTSYLPPSDIFTSGKIIASAVVPLDNLQHRGTAHELKSDTTIDVSLKVGNLSTPRELLNKYDDLKKQLDMGLDRFKEDSVVRRYICSSSKNPHLFHISDWTDYEVTLGIFGSIEDLVKKFAEVREVLGVSSEEKVGRSYEKEDVMRYDSAMAFINNSHLHVDRDKMDTLVSASNLKAEKIETIPWEQFYLELSHGARILDAKVKQFESMQWVKASFVA
jgi:hypothetical protein